MLDPLTCAAVVAFSWLWLWLPGTAISPLLQVMVYMVAVVGFICVQLERDGLLEDIL